MLNHFTPRAQHALALARKAADQYNSDVVDLEEIAIGMVELGQGSHFEIWKALGFDVNQFEMKVRTAAEARRKDVKPPSSIPYTGEVKRMLVVAAREAEQMNNSYVGTAHLLLGLLQVDSPGGRLLQEMGLTRDCVVEQALKKKRGSDW